MTPLGRLSIDDTPMAELTFKGEWVPVVGGDELNDGLCLLLNANYSPLRPTAFDDQLGFGWGPMKRVGDDIDGAQIDILVEPQPLPKGAIT